MWMIEGNSYRNHFSPEDQTPIRAALPFSAEPSQGTSSNLLISTPPTFTLLILRSSKESKQEIFEKPKKHQMDLSLRQEKKKQVQK